MESRRLGRTNIRVSALCLGTMQFGWTASEQDSQAIMDAYVEAGGNFLDTANVYSAWSSNSYAGKSEEIIGRWMALRGNRRNLVVATKVHGRMWEGLDGAGLGKAHILKAVEGSLQRLRTDYLDLYQTHATDSSVTHEETLETMDALVRAGKVRVIGCSNYTAEDLGDALSASHKGNLARFESIQPYYNVADRAEFEPGVLALCRKEQIGVIPYSPLAMGFLTGKYERGNPLPRSERIDSVRRRFLNDRGFQILDHVQAIATDRGVSPATVALAWLLHNPVITAPIIGANTVEQLAESLPVGTFRLADDEVETLSRLSAPTR